MKTLLNYVITKAFTWELGRQGSGYFKTLILTANWPLPFDFYIIRYPTGSYIPEHVDPVEPNANHYRLNIILKHAKKGGEFVINRCLFNSPRIKLFRPDKEPHQVSPVTKGERWVLSIGWKTYTVRS